MRASTAAPIVYDVVMLSFYGEERAGEVLQKLRSEKALEGCEIVGEAVVSRDPSGEIQLRERGSSGIGATFGAVTAGVLGLIGGPVILLLMVVVGGIAGGIAGHFAGQILPSDDLRTVGESLPAGSSAYLALVNVVDADQIATAFANEGARVMVSPVETDAANVIREVITRDVSRA